MSREGKRAFIHKWAISEQKMMFERDAVTTARKQAFNRLDVDIIGNNRAFSCIWRCLKTI